MLSRRGLIFGAAAMAAPAIIRPGLLMPVKRMLLPDGVALTSMAHPSGVISVKTIRELLLPNLRHVVTEYVDFEWQWGGLKLR